MASPRSVGTGRVRFGAHRRRLDLLPEYKDRDNLADGTIEYRDRQEHKRSL